MNGGDPSDALSKQIAERISKAEDDWKVDIVELEMLEMAGCMGCFGCWTRTPGICVVDDAARDVARKFVSSDLVVFISPVVFGGYSYHLKKAIDRLIPIVHPFFEKIDGEVHHAKRYDRYPSIIGMGIVESHDESEERTFRELVARNAINMHSPRFSSTVIARTESAGSVEEMVSKALLDVGVIR